MKYIDFDDWDEYEYNNKYSEYFDNFFNQKNKINTYGNINLQMNLKIFNSFKKYLNSNNINYHIYNEDYIYNLKSFYIYIVFSKINKKKYYLEIHSITTNEYLTINLIKI